MAPRLRSAVVRFDALPEPVLRVLFLALPVDARARAACVCRSWRAFLADPSLWQVLELNDVSVSFQRVVESDNLLRGAVARALGQLRVLSVRVFGYRRVTQMLLAAIASDGAQLEQVNTDAVFSVEDLEAVFAAAPRLQVLNASLMDSCAKLVPFLRNDAPYGPLRICNLEINRRDFSGFDETDVLALAAAVASHESLKRLTIRALPFARGLNALVDAAAERRILELYIDHNCVSDEETVPALARLLQRCSLTELKVSCDDFTDAPEASVLELCAALRACRTLTHLTLCLNPPDGVTRRVFAELLDAVAALPVLFKLNLDSSIVQDKADAGRALGALLSADLPRLCQLSVERCDLGDEGLGLLLDGLATNMHVSELECGVNGLSAAFERDHLEPALAAMEARNGMEAWLRQHDADVAAAAAADAAAALGSVSEDEKAVPESPAALQQ